LFDCKEFKEMKNLFVPVLFLLLNFSCNQVDKNPEFNILGYWNLSEVTNSWTNETIIGEELDFSERYIFNGDGTFIKTSIITKGQGETSAIPEQALGLFELIPSEESGYIFKVILTYDTNQYMAANCSEGNHEFLFVTGDIKLTNMTSAACDGPVFVYTKN
jgi:hypothetical protein